MQDVAGTAKGNWLLPTQTSFEKEDVEQKTISEEYVTLSRQISMTDFDPKIECKIDLDYLDDGQQAIS